MSITEDYARIMDEGRRQFPLLDWMADMCQYERSLQAIIDRAEAWTRPRIIIATGTNSVPADVAPASVPPEQPEATP